MKEKTTKNQKSAARGKKAELINERPTLALVEQIVEIVGDNSLSTASLSDAHPYLEEVAKRLEITEMEAVWFAIIANMADDHDIRVSDLSRFLMCRSIKVLLHWEEIESLAQSGYIRIRCKDADHYSLMMPSEVLQAVRKGEKYEAPNYKNIEADLWFDRLNELLCERDRGDLPYDDFLRGLDEIMEGNPQLTVVSKLKEYNLHEEDKIVLLRTMSNYIQDNDEHIGYGDIVDLLSNRAHARAHLRAIGRENHELQKKKLIENQNDDGRANSEIWHLTDKAKMELLSEIQHTRPSDIKKGLTLAEKIQEKKLFFSEGVNKTLTRLYDLLSADTFKDVQKRLEQKGMRKGFACIFYGTAGTGKTETVYQLAKKTGRDIMMVDVPNLRSKWVGDTEKNIKAVFDRYRYLAENSSIAPILLFNEADAVLCRRNENAITGVDKMENAMQNIILQEMENLDGIMIATTNLTENLDKAFERRFLYKVEFPKPTPAESVQIWKSMLPELTDENALKLAKSYSFSGGQIENIARKQIVDSILTGTDSLSMDSVVESCASELLRSKNNSHIGFA